MRKILTPEEIEHAKLLRSQGLSNRQIAEIFEVGKTTIWDNVYRQGKRIRVQVAVTRPTFKSIVSVKKLIIYLKECGFNSQEVSQQLLMPLREVNYIWTHLITTPMEEFEEVLEEEIKVCPADPAEAAQCDSCQ